MTETTYSGGNNINTVAWYEGNSSYNPHPVAEKAANVLGIYDMSGNVEEWCYDWYGNYNSDAQTDPTGASTGSMRVLRGGDFGDPEICCTVKHRGYTNPIVRSNQSGLRLALTAE